VEGIPGFAHFGDGVGHLAPSDTYRQGFESGHAGPDVFLQLRLNAHALAFSVGIAPRHNPELALLLSRISHFQENSSVSPQSRQRTASLQRVSGSPLGPVTPVSK
jgi:hypothetical protein